MDCEDFDDGLAPHEMLNGLGDDLSTMSIHGLKGENDTEKKERMNGDFGDGEEDRDVPHEPVIERPVDLPLESATPTTPSSFDTTPSLMSTTPGRFISLWVSTEDKDKVTTPDITSPTSSLPSPRPLSRDRSPSKKKKDPVVLLNHLDGSEVTDTLHCQAIQETSNQSGATPSKKDYVTSPTRHKPLAARSQDEKIRLAREFIDQYYAHAQRSGTVSHERRLYEVQMSIKETGSYSLTEAELIFGAKSAWRNLPQSRCRIYWNKLQVFDARKVTNSRDMFEMLCKHLLYATNKGNVRPAITVFPARHGDGQKDYRIWNPQLIGYAGYRQPDGSVHGDPSNLAFTEACQTLGWRGDRTRFDVLPLVLQVNGEDPEVFEIPSELVQEVELAHPELRWFMDLKLKWFSMPSHANFMLDIGGIQFPACPINEWYVACDIANNALCAPKRYNMLTMIAERLGLDISSTDSLWKDRTLVEMNVAVLHSFQQSGVTIMDHHTSSLEFMKFFAAEHELREGCPTDWRAVVSPLTASVTSLFHQETLNYQLMPTFTVQENPWDTSQWKSKLSSGRLSADRLRSPGADSSRFSSRILRRALSGTFKATVLYASEFGKAEYYAKKVYETFRKAFDIRLLRMDEYDVMNLEHENLLLVVSSTLGNGEPPSNGQDFCRYLMEMSDNNNNNNNKSSVPQSPKSPRCEKFCDGNPLSDVKNGDGFNLRGSGMLGSLSYGVFGLGSSIYPYYCAFARGVDTMLDSLGGDRLVDMGCGDEMGGLHETFDAWLMKTFMTACEKFHIGDSASGITPNLAAPGPDWAASKFRIYAAGMDVKATSPAPALCDALTQLHGRKVFPCNIISRKSLLPSESSRATILVRLNTNGEKAMAYQPGDHVGIYPSNENALVARVLKRLDYHKSPDAVFKLEKLEPRETQLGMLKVWTTVSRLPSCSMRTALERYLDLTTPPTPDFLRLLATRATDPRDKDKLNILGMGCDEYEEWKSENWPNMAEVLEGYPSLKVPASLLLTQLPLLRPRYFSISSSPKQYPNEIHATVSVVSYHPNGGRGPVHYGACSSWLYRVWKDDVIPAFVSSAPYFHLPVDTSAPIIMVGPGSGVAPFRSFWQDRQTDLRQLASFPNEASRSDEVMDSRGKRGEGDGSDTFGDMTLVYGCRNAKEDLYKGETSVAKDEGALTAVLTGYSREHGKPRKYVQDILKDHPWLVYNVLYRRQGHIYVSGDVNMVKEVSNTVEVIIAQFGRLGAAEAKEFVRKMKDEDHYHEEMYGLTLHVSEVMEKIRARKKGTQVMVMNEESPRLQPIIGRKGAALAKQQDALRKGITPGSPTMPRLRRRVTATILMRYNSLMGMDKKTKENDKPMSGVKLRRKPADDIAARTRRYEDGRRYSTGSSSRVPKP